MSGVRPDYGKWLLTLLGAVPGIPGIAAADGLDPIAAEDEPALRVDALYVGDVWRNTTGGLRTGSAYLGNANVSVAVDGERTLGLDGTTFYVDAQSVHGQGVTSRLIGDAQTVSNIEADSQLRLYEIWMERSFGRSSGGGAGRSLRFGLYDLNSEFDSLDTAGLFLNSSHGIGPQLAQTGLNGPSIFPTTSLGARLQWSFSPEWSGRVALLDGVPGDPQDPRLNRVRFGAHDGLLAITEVGYAGARLYKVAVGAWTYTERFDEIAAVDPEAVDAEDEAARSRGNRGFYAMAGGQLYAERDDSSQGLSAFARVGTANEHINRFENYAGAGFVYTGALPQRPVDQLGIAIASVGNGNVFRRAQLAEGASTDSRETTVEVSYRFGVTEWLTLQTSIQHIHNPDTNPGLQDAMACALRFELARGWSWPPSSRNRN